MHKTLIALATAAAFAGAGVALPSRAEAQAWWVIPAIVAAGVGTVVVATAVSARDDTRPYEPRGVVQVRPYGSQCYFERRQTPQGLRNVQVCY